MGLDGGRAIGRQVGRVGENVLGGRKCKEIESISYFYSLLLLSQNYVMSKRIKYLPRTQASPHSFFRSHGKEYFFRGCEKARPGYKATLIHSLIMHAF